MNILQKSMCRFIIGMSNRNVLKWVPDKTYLKMLFWARMGKKLDLKHPRTFNEILQWLKLYDRKPIYEKMVDKYEVKQYVTEKIGEEYVIPVLGIWDRFDDIDFDKLPDQFVLKCTHDSGGLFIVKDKNNMDLEVARKKIKKCLKANYYWHGREWPYKNVRPRVIAEQYMEDGETGELRDYKFYTFNGKVKALLIATNRQSSEKDTTLDYFDADLNWLDFRWGKPNAKEKPQRPDHFELMKTLAEKLSANIPHVRVDFYEVNGKVYFGEMTFFDGSGFEKFEPSSWDCVFGEWLTLPQK